MKSVNAFGHITLEYNVQLKQDKKNKKDKIKKMHLRLLSFKQKGRTNNSGIDGPVWDEKCGMVITMSTNPILRN